VPARRLASDSWSANCVSTLCIKSSIENVHIVRGTVDDIEVVDVYEATDESVVFDLKAVCSVDVQFYVLKDEAHLLDRRDRRMISDWDADENYALSEANFDELEVELTGTFDRVYRYLTDLEVVSIHKIRDHYSSE
jgi:hypothetical protein